jgi:hypothetical protein
VDASSCDQRAARHGQRLAQPGEGSAVLLLHQRGGLAGPAFRPPLGDSGDGVETVPKTLLPGLLIAHGLQYSGWMCWRRNGAYHGFGNIVAAGQTDGWSRIMWLRNRRSDFVTNCTNSNELKSKTSVQVRVMRGIRDKVELACKHTIS